LTTVLLTIFMQPLCLQPAVVQICPSVLNGALLLEHNVALYLERCSESVGSIHMDHCYCNAPLLTRRGGSRYAEVAEVGRSTTVDTLPDHQSSLEDHSLTNRQQV